MIGWIGIHTAVKPGKFAFTNNMRDKSSGNGDGTIWNNLLEMLGKKSLPQFYEARLIVENSESYQEAFDALISTPVISGVYYILSGINSDEGCVIT